MILLAYKSATAVTRYTVTDLGTLDGGPYSLAHDVNNTVAVRLLTGEKGGRVCIDIGSLGCFWYFY